MLNLCDPVGATYYFRVTGEAAGSLWGTDVYTGDSALAAAAVHAGLVKVGETAVVKVIVEQPRTKYQGSVRNGVTSQRVRSVRDSVPPGGRLRPTPVTCADGPTLPTYLRGRPQRITCGWQEGKNIVACSDRAEEMSWRKATPCRQYGRQSPGSRPAGRRKGTYRNPIGSALPAPCRWCLSWPAMMNPSASTLKML